MTAARGHRPSIVWIVAMTIWTVYVCRAEEPTVPREGPFGYTLVRTDDNQRAEIDFFFLNQDCAVCHPRQLAEVQGSLHSAAHTDPLYRNLAVLARQEAGEKVYAYCSGCHSPAGVVSALIPALPEDELPAEAKAGVTCDVCHQISDLTGPDGPWGEPGNASFVLKPGRIKYGHSGVVVPNRSHTGEKKAFFSKSEFCASCHTVIHPVNGLRIEHTYGEWKSSVYAEKGIQCQDCHMRSVQDAVTVARTLKPVAVQGQSVVDGPARQIFSHFFVGASADAGRLADGPKHAQMAEARLKSAARIEIDAPESATAGEELQALDVFVHNVAAGHNIPTGVTELRQMWVELRLIDKKGNLIVRHGGLDEQKEIERGTIRFGAVAADQEGKETYRLWEMERFLWKRTIPPKSFTRDSVSVKVPSGMSGAVTIEATLLYRSVSPLVVRQIIRDNPFEPKIIQMCRARTTVALR